MTYLEWIATRQAAAVLSDAQAGGYAGQSGYQYEAGFIIVQDDGRCMVPLAIDEETFATLAEAEAYLWREWCDGELNG